MADRRTKQHDLQHTRNGRNFEFGLEGYPLKAGSGRSSLGTLQMDVVIDVGILLVGKPGFSSLWHGFDVPFFINPRRVGRVSPYIPLLSCT